MPSHHDERSSRGTSSKETDKRVTSGKRSGSKDTARKGTSNRGAGSGGSESKDAGRLRPGRQMLAGRDVTVDVKKVKTVRLKVCPPHGELRLTAPPSASRAAVEQFVASRLEWVDRHQERFRRLPKPEEARFVGGELHYVAGDPYELTVVTGARRSTTLDRGRLVMTAPEGSTAEQLGAQHEAWLRRRLAAEMVDLAAAWVPRIGTPYPELRTKRMSSRWGSCNTAARRVWLNTALAMRRPALTEYVFVHELVHLLVPNHGPDFKRLMATHLPAWRELDAELDAWPLWSPTPG